MKQQTFTDFEYNQHKKKTHREEFLDAIMVRMDCDDSAILSFRKAWSSSKRY